MAQRHVAEISNPLSVHPPAPDPRLDFLSLSYLLLSDTPAQLSSLQYETERRKGPEDPPDTVQRATSVRVNTARALGRSAETASLLIVRDEIFSTPKTGPRGPVDFYPATSLVHWGVRARARWELRSGRTARSPDRSAPACLLSPGCLPLRMVASEGGDSAIQLAPR